jgi:hypothetical protein
MPGKRFGAEQIPSGACLEPIIAIPVKTEKQTEKSLTRIAVAVAVRLRFCDGIGVLNPGIFLQEIRYQLSSFAGSRSDARPHRRV